MKWTALTPEQICKMPGRSRLECFGCPMSSCPYVRSPFDDLAETAQKVVAAVELLRANRVWLMGERAGTSVPGRVLYESLGDNPEGELLARLLESSGQYMKNAAVEGVAAGALSIEEGAELARMQRNDRTVRARGGSLQGFLQLVEERQDMLSLGDPDVGRQRHSRALSGADGWT